MKKVKVKVVRLQWRSKREAFEAVKFVCDSASDLQGCLSPDECELNRRWIKEIRRDLNTIVKNALIGRVQK